MVKKICFMLVFVIMIILCSVSAFAGSDSSAYDSDTKATKEKFFSVTKPEEAKLVTIHSKSYTISGVATADNIVVELYRLNEEKKQYEKISIEDKSSWKLDNSGIFAKEISMKEGVNKIMLVAYKESDEKEQQRSIYEIKYVKKNVLEDIKEKIDDTIKSLFGKN